jgi:hypothetical protein
LGYNVGTEKNKIRPVLVVSNSKINQAEKVMVLVITDAKGKLNSNDLPLQDSWYLLYSDTSDDNKKIYPDRMIKKGNSAYRFLEKDSGYIINVSSRPYDLYGIASGDSPIISGSFSFTKNLSAYKVHRFYFY